MTLGHLIVTVLLFVVCVTTPARAETVEDELTRFEMKYNLTNWPKLDGCRYAMSFEGHNVGVILKVLENGIVLSRWDGRCHVPIRHIVKGLPPALPGGVYVAAVTSMEGHDARDNRYLKLLGLAGSKPDDQPLLKAAIKRICTGWPQVADNDCADDNSR